MAEVSMTDDIGILDQYRRIFENSPDIGMVFKSSVGIDGNDAAASLFQMKRDNLIRIAPEQFSPGLQPDGRDFRIPAEEITEQRMTREPWLETEPRLRSLQSGVAVLPFVFEKNHQFIISGGQNPAGQGI